MDEKMKGGCCSWMNSINDDVEDDGGHAIKDVIYDMYIKHCLIQ
jgi:hypothetical protein